MYHAFIEAAILLHIRQHLFQLSGKNKKQKKKMQESKARKGRGAYIDEPCDLSEGTYLWEELRELGV